MLREYQQLMVDRTRAAWGGGARAVLLTAPTGAGKTHIIAELARQHDGPVVVLTHRREILRQDQAAIGDSANVLCMTIQTAARRGLPPASLLVVDEAHLALARTWKEAIVSAPYARVLGVTATPYRTDGQGLGDIFNAIVVGPSTQALIELGFLVRARTFAPTIPDVHGLKTQAGDFEAEGLSVLMRSAKITGDIVEHYQRLAAGRQTLVFAVDIAHSKELSAALGAEHVDGTMPTKQRDEIVARFSAGATRCLCSCNILAEGLDVPGASCIILARPTQSEVLYRQQIGRGSRPFAGKEDFVILDHAGNALRHGLFADEKRFTLDGRRKTKRERIDGDGSIRQCLTCYAVYESPKDACPYCGAVKPVKTRHVKEIAGVLVEVDHLGVPLKSPGSHKRMMREIWRGPAAKWEPRLIELAQAMGYSRGWVRVQLSLKLTGRVMRPMSEVV